MQFEVSTVAGALGSAGVLRDPKRTSDGCPRHSRLSARVARVTGTPVYLPPEVLLEQGVTRKASAAAARTSMSESSLWGGCHGPGGAGDGGFSGGRGGEV